MTFDFKHGDIVWGKIRGLPHWPGQILDKQFASQNVLKSYKPGCVLVCFFGDDKYNWLDRSALRTCHGLKDPVADSCKKHRSKASWKLALEQAQELLDRRANRQPATAHFPRDFLTDPPTADKQSEALPGSSEHAAAEYDMQSVVGISPDVARRSSATAAASTAAATVTAAATATAAAIEAMPEALLQPAAPAWDRSVHTAATRWAFGSAETCRMALSWLKSAARSPQKVIKKNTPSSEPCIEQRQLYRLLLMRSHEAIQAGLKDAICIADYLNRHTPFGQYLTSLDRIEVPRKLMKTYLTTLKAAPDFPLHFTMLLNINGQYQPALQCLEVWRDHVPDTRTVRYSCYGLDYALQSYPDWSVYLVSWRILDHGRVQLDVRVRQKALNWKVEEEKLDAEELEHLAKPVKVRQFKPRPVAVLGFPTQVYAARHSSPVLNRLDSIPTSTVSHPAPTIAAAPTIPAAVREDVSVARPEPARSSFDVSSVALDDSDSMDCTNNDTSPSKKKRRRPSKSAKDGSNKSQKVASQSTGSVAKKAGSSRTSVPAASEDVTPAAPRNRFDNTLDVPHNTPELHTAPIGSYLPSGKGLTHNANDANGHAGCKSPGHSIPVRVVSVDKGTVQGGQRGPYREKTNQVARREDLRPGCEGLEKGFQGARNSDKQAASGTPATHTAGILDAAMRDTDPGPVVAHLTGTLFDDIFHVAEGLHDVPPIPAAGLKANPVQQAPQLTDIRLMEERLKAAEHLVSLREQALQQQAQLAQAKAARAEQLETRLQAAESCIQQLQRHLPVPASQGAIQSAVLRVAAIANSLSLTALQSSLPESVKLHLTTVAGKLMCLPVDHPPRTAHCLANGSTPSSAHSLPISSQPAGKQLAETGSGLPSCSDHVHLKPPLMCAAQKQLCPVAQSYKLQPSSSAHAIAATTGPCDAGTTASRALFQEEVSGIPTQVTGVNPRSPEKVVDIMAPAGHPSHPSHHVVTCGSSAFMQGNPGMNRRSHTAFQSSPVSPVHSLLSRSPPFQPFYYPASARSEGRYNPPTDPRARPVTFQHHSPPLSPPPTALSASSPTHALQHAATSSLNHDQHITQPASSAHALKLAAGSLPATAPTCSQSNALDPLSALPNHTPASLRTCAMTPAWPALKHAVSNSPVSLSDHARMYVSTSLPTHTLSPAPDHVVTLNVHPQINQHPSPSASDHVVTLNSHPQINQHPFPSISQPIPPQHPPIPQVQATPAPLSPPFQPLTSIPVVTSTPCNRPSNPSKASPPCTPQDEPTATGAIPSTPDPLSERRNSGGNPMVSDPAVGHQSDPTPDPAAGYPSKPTPDPAGVDHSRLAADPASTHHSMPVAADSINGEPPRHKHLAMQEGAGAHKHSLQHVEDNGADSPGDPRITGVPHSGHQVDLHPARGHNHPPADEMMGATAAHESKKAHITEHNHESNRDVCSYSNGAGVQYVRNGWDQSHGGLCGDGCALDDGPVPICDTHGAMHGWCLCLLLGCLISEVHCLPSINHRNRNIPKELNDLSNECAVWTPQVVHDVSHSSNEDVRWLLQVKAEYWLLVFLWCAVQHVCAATLHGTSLAANDDVLGASHDGTADVGACSDTTEICRYSHEAPQLLTSTHTEGGPTLSPHTCHTDVKSIGHWQHSDGGKVPTCMHDAAAPQVPSLVNQGDKSQATGRQNIHAAQMPTCTDMRDAKPQTFNHNSDMANQLNRSGTSDIRLVGTNPHLQEGRVSPAAGKSIEQSGACGRRASTDLVSEPPSMEPNITGEGGTQVTGYDGAGCDDARHAAKKQKVKQGADIKSSVGHLGVEASKDDGKELSDLVDMAARVEGKHCAGCSPMTAADTGGKHISNMGSIVAEEDVGACNQVPGVAAEEGGGQDSAAAQLQLPKEEGDDDILEEEDLGEEEDIRYPPKLVMGEEVLLYSCISSGKWADEQVPPQRDENDGDSRSARPGREHVPALQPTKRQRGLGSPQGAAPQITDGAAAGWRTARPVGMYPSCQSPAVREDHDVQPSMHTTSNPQTTNTGCDEALNATHKSRLDTPQGCAGADTATTMHRHLADKSSHQGTTSADQLRQYMPAPPAMTHAVLSTGLHTVSAPSPCAGRGGVTAGTQGTTAMDVENMTSMVNHHSVVHKVSHAATEGPADLQQAAPNAAGGGAVLSAQAGNPGEPVMATAPSISSKGLAIMDAAGQVLLVASNQALECDMLTRVQLFSISKQLTECVI